LGEATFADASSSDADAPKPVFSQDRLAGSAKEQVAAAAGNREHYRDLYRPGAPEWKLKPDRPAEADVVMSIPG